MSTRRQHIELEATPSRRRLFEVSRNVSAAALWHKARQYTRAVYCEDEWWRGPSQQIERPAAHVYPVVEQVCVVDVAHELLAVISNGELHGLVREVQASEGRLRASFDSS